MNTYLYGVGPRTERYIAAHPEMVISGILDGYRNSGEFCGIRIMDLEQIATDNTKIIIVARTASARIIYARIKDFCTERKIKIFDTDGREAAFLDHDSLPDPQKINIDVQKLYREIDRHDVISFDIFDTLLIRKCGGVKEIFTYVALQNGLYPRFANAREKAEKELAQIMVPSIEDIYRNLAEEMSITWEECGRILAEEIAAEKKFLVVRKDIAEALRYAVSKGKQVYILSDMYFDRETLREILEEKGIAGYQDILVSSEYGTDKAGKLFDIFISRAAAKNILHIGDDEYRDLERGEKHGIDVYPVRTTTESCGWNLASPETLGYSLLAPVLLSFAYWLDISLRKEGIPKIYFCARDGYLVKQIFDMVECGMADPIRSEYLLISRSLTAAASISDEDDMKRCMEMSFDGAPDEMLKKRFYLGEEEIMPYEEDMRQEDYILQHAGAILKRAESLKSSYLKYLAKIGVTNSGKEAIFDFVSTGTCQMCLERITGKKLYGYYYEAVDDGMPCKSGLQKRSLIQEIEIMGQTECSCDNYFLIETFIKETVPTLREIDEEGNPVYGREHMETEQEEIIKTVQNEALQYVKDRLKIIPGGQFDAEEARNNAMKLKRITAKYLPGNMNFNNYDAFSNRKSRE